MLRNAAFVSCDIVAAKYLCYDESGECVIEYAGHACEQEPGRQIMGDVATRLSCSLPNREHRHFCSWIPGVGFIKAVLVI